MWEYRARLERVIDGDTIDLGAVDLGFGIHLIDGPDKRLRVRLLGVNTPERGQVDWGYATDVTRDWLLMYAPPTAEWPLIIQSRKPVKADSFGRWLVRVWTSDRSRCLNDDLRAKGWPDLTHPYD